jgi:hypothetical protein
MKYVHETRSIVSDLSCNGEYLLIAKLSDSLTDYEAMRLGILFENAEIMYNDFSRCVDLCAKIAEIAGASVNKESMTLLSDIRNAMFRAKRERKI